MNQQAPLENSQPPLEEQAKLRFVSEFDRGYEQGFRAAILNSGSGSG